MDRSTALPRGTKSEILDVAQEMIQTLGYNAVSFHDVAARLGIRSASVHYHFRTKADLAFALLTRHRQFIVGNLSKIDSEGHTPRRKLERFIRMLHLGTYGGTRMCLYGVLAAEAASLPATALAELALCVSFSENWLTNLFTNARDQGLLTWDAPPPALAISMHGALIGTGLFATALSNSERLKTLERHALSLILPARPG